MQLESTHHRAPRLYWLNATRFHPLDLFGLIACQNLPLILLGAPPRVFAMYVLFSVVYGQLQHGNIELRTRALDWLFSTPGLHRFHHSTDTREGNANYGAILIGWDLVFRSFFRSFNMLDAPDALLKDPIVLQAAAAAHATKDQRPPAPTVGPPRDELLAVMATATTG